MVSDGLRQRIDELLEYMVDGNWPRHDTALLITDAPPLLRECRDEIASLERHHEIVRNGAMDQAIESDAEITRLRDALAEKDAEIERLRLVEACVRFHGTEACVLGQNHPEVGGAR